MFQTTVKGGKQNTGAEITAVSDEGFAAVDDEVIAVAGVGGGGTTGVTAGVRFGQQKAADFFAAVECRQPLLFLLFSAEGLDRAAAEGGMRRDQNATGAAGFGYFFDDDGV